MRALFVENDCSFSNNIVERLPRDRAAIRVVHGRDRARISDLLPDTDVLILGSGPLDPVRADLVGLVHEAVGRAIPVLGICLGHQAVGQAFGATLIRTVPAHGVPAVAHFGPSRLFAGIEGPQRIMRYHSLSLGQVPPPLRVVAHADGIPMAIEHETLPIAGLQFHPDSFGTPRGEAMIGAFFAAAVDRPAQRGANHAALGA